MALFMSGWRTTDMSLNLFSPTKLNMAVFPSWCQRDENIDNYFCHILLEDVMFMFYTCFSVKMYQAVLK